ncbi:hypothetical protein M404DRAFT_335788 [Pisolithus tinctorius Marx 270]|uniref:Uncharacterized protein n=1 Tax=Pisolithus tinctorius Marx 270 TaxID=870435 RepID=A0A0C3JB82_PISTI|nr:hypothetical protein M404DRAFT_335788 [Pisolithus tinctorius Marx 270]
MRWWLERLLFHIPSHSPSCMENKPFSVLLDSLTMLRTSTALPSHSPPHVQGCHLDHTHHGTAPSYGSEDIEVQEPEYTLSSRDGCTPLASKAHLPSPITSNVDFLTPRQRRLQLPSYPILPTPFLYRNSDTTNTRVNHLVRYQNNARVASPLDSDVPTVSFTCL